jgi:hypothetical protein
VAEENVIARCDGTTTLTLTRDQAAALGIGRPYAGTVKELGAALGLDSWKAQGAAGRRIMVRAAGDHAREQEQQALERAAEIMDLRERRRLAKRSLEFWLDLARKLDPERATRNLFERHRHDTDHYWGWGSVPGTISVGRWRELTDVALFSLSEARRDIRELLRLESAARAAGLDALYAEGKLEKLLDQTEIKVRLLLFWRTRMTRAS